MCGTQQRDLLVLVALALSAVQSAPTQEGACQVWLGLGLGLGLGRASFCVASQKLSLSR